MKPLYTQAEFDTAKSRDKLPLECKSCGNPFLKSKNNIYSSLKGHPRFKLDFCSWRCGAQYRFKLSTSAIRCYQCDSPFIKTLSQIKQTKHNFCSQSCAAKWHNAHKTKGTRVSKLERWLQEQLPRLFPGLEFHFNRTDAVNAELDIFIPSLKLAFELNGIFHYEPIYGPEKLGRIQNNDERKMQACLERNIELCVIDVSSSAYFKPARVQKFLDIIVNIIKTKLSKSLLPEEGSNLQPASPKPAALPVVLSGNH